MRSRLAVLIVGLAWSGGVLAQEKPVFRPLDLSTFYTESFSDFSSGRPWNKVPRGAQTLDGIPYKIAGKLEVTGMDAARHGDFRNAQVKGIPVGQKAGRLHLLHGATHGLKDGIPLSSVVLNYAGGETRAVRLVYGVHARNWVRHAGERQDKPEDPNSSIAWSYSEETDSFDGTLRFYKTALDNPLPDREIVSLDVVSLFGKASPVIFALTLEEKPGAPLLPPSTGKLATKSAEIPDSAYRQQIALHITEADGKTPLTNAVAQLAITDDASTFFFGESAADANGAAQVTFPVQQTLALRLFVKAPGHAPEVITARARDAKGFPRALNIALARGTKIGGVVRNEAGQPVYDAEVLIARVEKTGEGEFTRTIFDLVSTDPAGRWSSERVPQVLSGFSFKVTHSDLKPATYELAAPGITNGLQVSSADLLAGRAELKVAQRIRVTGLVADAKGAALTNVDVFLYTESYGPRRGKTDTQGKFSFISTESTKGAIAVLAPNYAPMYQALDVDTGLKPLRLTPVKGLPLKAQVRDQDGTPVAGVSVLLEQWNSTRLVTWKAVTDSEGRFAWANAPVGGLNFSIDKNGYSTTRLLVAVPATGEAAVTLRKSSRAYGSVVDGQTGQLLDSYTVIKGHRSSPDEPLRWNRGYAEKFKRGNFSMGLNEYSGGETRILIEVPGYLPSVSGPITKAGFYTNRYVLRRGRGLAGTVQWPDGTPVPKISVMLVEPGETLQMDYTASLERNARVGEYDLTDPTGHFSLASRYDAKNIFAAGNAGFGQTTVRELAAGGKMILQPWGRLKGVLRVGEKPQPYQHVLLHNLEHDYGDAGRTNFNVFLRTRADVKGNFFFDRVPPGEWQVSMQNRFRDLAGGPLILSHGQPVLVKSGVTNEITLGGSGLTLTGRVDVTGIDASEIDWLRDAHRLVLQLPGLPDLTPPDLSRAKSEADRLKLTQEFNVRQKTFWTSDKGRAATRAQRSYALIFETNGCFHVHNVPPGAYQLTIAPTLALLDKYTNAIYTSALLGFLTRPVVVKPAADGALSSLGVLKLEASAPARPGQSAPPLPAKTFAGRAVKVEEYRGKYLLLDFWTATMDSRGSELDILKSLAVADTNRLAVLSVNLDQEQKIAEAYVSMSGMHWPQAYLGPWAESKTPAAFGADAPGSVLIDPEGKLVSRLLRGDLIRTAVDKALAAPGN